MTSLRESTWSRNRPGGGGRACQCAALLMLLLAGTASGQDVRNPQPGGPPTQQEPTPMQSAPARPPGFLETIGRWFDGSVSGLSSGLKGTQDRLGNFGNQAGHAAAGAAGAAKDAVDAVARLPAMRVVDGRGRCAIAANGAPDCVAAATAICRGKGFNAGQSVNIESAQKCPAHVLLLGRRVAEHECKVETFVTRAMCQ